jgi:polysaccharide export outer membrane protein
MARRAFHVACEEACDDWAVATGSNPVDLADMLTAWMHGSRPKATLLAIGMSSTKARTLRLLALHATPTAKLARRWHWAGACAAVLIVAGLAVAQPPNDHKQEALQLAPKETTRLAPLDKVRIDVHGTIRDQPISGTFQVDSDGEIVLGPVYGAVKVGRLTRSEAQEAVKRKLQTVLKEPDVALIVDESRREAGIAGEHLVGPDGTITLGVYGSVKVSGLTLADARAAVETKLSDSFVEPKVAVDVSKYNSKVYYLIVNELGYHDHVLRMSTTGNETVMDAISEYQNSVNWTSPIKTITIARPKSASSKRETLEVHWKDVLHGDDTTNYQILPGDRVFIEFEQPGRGGAFGGDAFDPQPKKPPPFDPSVPPTGRTSPKQ